MINIETISNNPGCYLFKDRSSNIIYVGKAKDLKKRVSSYFSKKDHDPKTRQLLKNTYSVDFILTENEVEALILENTLIKKHKPKYNINLKDSKRYTYILLTSEKFPRLILARYKNQAGKFFGPFTSGSSRKRLMQLLIRLFNIRTCKKFPKKPCLRYHIKLCNAPCIGNVSIKEYNEDISKALKVLSGKTNNLIKELKESMKKSSISKDFEKAIVIRDQISSLEYLNEKQIVERQKRYDEDIINFVVRSSKVYLLLFHINKGVLTNKQEFSFGRSIDFLEEFLIQYYSEYKVPKELILPVKVSDAIHSFLENKKDEKVILTVPKIGEKKALLELVKKNIEITFFSEEFRLEKLKERLKLENIPEVIECFDISHLSGEFTVGSMVQYRSGKPDKNNYRRFKIRSYTGSDDTKGISEVVRRRYTRLKSEQAEFPDLIIIDGGKGQLNSALNELEKLGLRIPVISIAKKFEEIYMPGLSFPLRLSGKDKALQLIEEIRDEAHRFAVGYNRLLRKKDIIKK